MDKKLNYLRIGICILIMVCIVQAFYYPFMTSPGIQVEWWQIGPLAGVGFFLGLPVFILSENLFDTAVSRQIFAWVASCIWLGIIYLFLGTVFKYIVKVHNQSLQRTR